ncbi:hypothetical protein [Longirhabdus pacifica]|uniref:hypothetical protein n=1 Tax=Longirhabdus pacifica TaxID=2305227 RepID=UPI001F0BF14D|nr:hypothetical protein [Longirhabdus pacifica]
MSDRHMSSGNKNLQNVVDQLEAPTVNAHYQQQLQQKRADRHKQNVKTNDKGYKENETGYSPDKDMYKG